MASATVLAGVKCLSIVSVSSSTSRSTARQAVSAGASAQSSRFPCNDRLRPAGGLSGSTFVTNQACSTFRVPVGNATGSGASSTTCKVDTGDVAPNFTLKDQNGRDVSLSKYKGKPVVLYFYPKDDTPGCTKQACYFRDSYEAYKKAGAEVIGISADPVDSHKAFAEKHNLPFTLLSDENSAVRKEFGIKNDFLGALPGRQTYLLDGSGVVKLVYNNQFMPEKHISETLRVIEIIKPEQKELKDLPKAGLGMIGKMFKNPEQIQRGGKKDDEA
eukprot:TRINITY_DN17790_c0_g1_i1.p1 TRINITY_DN17790_c0_g1~~TRINITY_DN17790_c0_g1_i1.p1  ORF type:complete len:273 (+),score=51.76 TRINITY_DN17790_c0_g1_i1:110-928(+)